MAQERIEHLPSLSRGYFFILVLVTLDIISKYLAKQFLELNEMIPMIPSLDLLLVFNTGVAFSMLDFDNAFTHYGLSIIGFILVGYLYLMLRKEEVAINYWALILIISGALGNLFDRLLDGEVTDFLYFHTDSFSFFIFNLADAFISIGAAIFIIAELRKYLSPQAS
jgi:signal peptidase II|tara:strand:+ start:2767 stop:3267 length:501 start_codon:yes stop_codon:yes gene_type:complete